MSVKEYASDVDLSVKVIIDLCNKLRAMMMLILMICVRNMVIGFMMKKFLQRRMRIIMKKVPMRSCVVTGEKLEKHELIRVVRDKDGHVFVDDTYKANGRGAYLKRDVDVINRAKKNKILDRRLEVEVPDSIYEELVDMI